jgi:hypothetical protein
MFALIAAMPTAPTETPSSSAQGPIGSAPTTLTANLATTAPTLRATDQQVATNRAAVITADITAKPGANKV